MVVLLLRGALLLSNSLKLLSAALNLVEIDDPLHLFLAGEL